MKLRTLIIEDEAPAYRRLNGLIGEHHPQLEVIDVLDSITAAVRWFGENKAPELIFSDIQLSDGLSFRIYEQVPAPCPIIFTTAYDSYMMEAFRTNGIDYLLKPIEEEELARSIGKYMGLSQPKPEPQVREIERLLKSIGDGGRTYRDRFLVKLGTKLLPVSTGEIAYLLHSDGVCTLHLRNGKKHLIDLPLDEIEQQLDPRGFFRLNRQCIAHIGSIDVVHQHFQGKLKVVLRPESSEEIMVSREKARAFKSWMDGA